MLKDSQAFSSFSFTDTDKDKIKAFYADTLGLDAEDTPMGLNMHLAGGTKVFMYPKPNHQPASHTVLNFPVEDIDAAVDDLTAKGVTMERIEMEAMSTDEKGIMRSDSPEHGPDVAWFKDPCGNTLSVLKM